ncbi:hypothetical protein [Buchananella hordeovulneris]|uniref:hypothetical protein n=1 Tax=Buchananella hordeovulneris TaxID=52770 RepID=UPI000F5F7016|nr:hypothetical protein [Buchananella hordeovulneris]RRD44021.1 hypothetical protein EII13_04740 [Buchananella hordeovulneris]
MPRSKAMNTAAAHPVRFSRAQALLAACCAAALLVPLGGCGVRLAAPPTTIPTLSPQAQLRDELSRREAAISKGALALIAPASTATPAPSSAVGASDTELTRLASRSQDRLTALGGVWTPWPQGAPPGADAGPAPRPLPADQPALLAELELAVKAAQVATAQEADPALTQLYASLYVSYSLDADALATALQQPRAAQGTEGVSAPAAPSPPAPGSESTTTPVVLSATATDALFQLQWYTENAAMRANEDEQQRLLAAAADTRTQLTDSLRGGGPGPRTLSFPFDSSSSDQQWVQQAAVTATDALLVDLVASPAGSPARQALLARLLHTARTARDFGISPTELLPLSPL